MYRAEWDTDRQTLGAGDETKRKISHFSYHGAYLLVGKKGNKETTHKSYLDDNKFEFRNTIKELHKILYGAY